MAFDFPASPSVGTLFAPAGGPTWQWNGTAWLATAPSGLVPEAPADGQNYVRRNGVWVLAPGTAEAKNRVVNPAMQVSQENGDTASNVSGYYPADQWMLSTSGVVANCGRATAASAPTSNHRRIGASVTTARPSPSAGDFMAFNQLIEGTRVADFDWGTANAKQAVLRFWATASAVGGTFTVSVRNGAANRTFLAPITLPLNVWTLVTLVIPGDTGGTWATDNAAGFNVGITFAAGSTYQGVAGWQAGNFLALPTATNGAATVGNGLYFGDVGLYLDPQNTGIAPPWQMPDEAQELAACQRYWQLLQLNIVAYASSAGAQYGSNYPYPVMMRTSPALAQFAAGAGANFTSASFDTQSVRTARQFIVATGVGLAYMNDRLFAANARM